MKLSSSSLGPFGYMSKADSPKEKWCQSCVVFLLAKLLLVAWRIRFALYLKCGFRNWINLCILDLVITPENVELDTRKFERLNPLHYVPVLVDDIVVLSDSYAIFLHLEEKYTQNPLLPVDPQLRALNLQVASIIHSSIQPLHMDNVLVHSFALKCLDWLYAQIFCILTLLFTTERYGENVWRRNKTVGPIYHRQRLLGVSSIVTPSLLTGRCTTALEKLLKDFAVYVFLAPQLHWYIDLSKSPTLSRLYEAYKALPEFQASSVITSKTT
ncbi:hypothetical protein VNO77_07143 [Canavalia gladiata]|uniref:GST N-terminal domain-containing protein n=1 Tax=Canavalia gladiata TaxID=3824 RepID=A0AAN9MB57_CANGL